MTQATRRAAYPVVALAMLALLAAPYLRVAIPLMIATQMGQG